MNNTIKQGDIYWIKSDEGVSHPHVIIDDSGTFMICALTTNANKISMPGNVSLDIGEANLEKESIVEVSKVTVLDNSLLGEYIGTLGDERVKQIQAGINFIQKSFFTPPNSTHTK